MTYETESYWTVDELKKLNIATLFNNSKAYMVTSVLVEVFVLFCAWFSSQHVSIIFPIIFLLYAIIFPVLLYLKCAVIGPKKTYNTSKYLQNRTIKYIFHEDRLEVSSERGNSYIKYDELYKIVETNTNFYLYVNKKAAYNVIKENADQGLMSFLRYVKVQYGI